MHSAFLSHIELTHALQPFEHQAHLRCSRQEGNRRFMATVASIRAAIDDAGLGQPPLSRIGQFDIGLLLECFQNFPADTVMHDASQINLGNVSQHQIHSAVSYVDESIRLRVAQAQMEAARQLFLASPRLFHDLTLVFLRHPQDDLMRFLPLALICHQDVNFIPDEGIRCRVVEEMTSKDKAVWKENHSSRNLFATQPVSNF